MSNVVIDDLVVDGSLDKGDMNRIKGGWQFGWIQPYRDNLPSTLIPPQAAQYITQYITNTTDITNNYHFVNVDIEANNPGEFFIMLPIDALPVSDI